MNQNLINLIWMRLMQTRIFKGIYTDKCLFLSYHLQEDYNLNFKFENMQDQNQNSSSLVRQCLTQLQQQSNKNKQPQSSSEKPSKQEKGLGCNCKKSKCQKMYCECFTIGQKCSDSCRCIDCQNTFDRNEKIDMNENYQNFKLLLARRNSQNKGCNCMKSNCLKKYCECFQNQQPCSQYCKCEDCKNSECHISKRFNDNNPIAAQKQSTTGLGLKMSRHQSEMQIERDIDQRLDALLKMVPKSSQQKVMRYVHMLLTIK